jgi:DNA-binding MarR family transcriptional regulator
MSSTEGLKKAIAVLETFANYDRDMQMQTILAFLYVALENEMGRTANVGLVRDQVGVTSASATRNVQYWTDRNRYGQKGKECLESVINPANKTEKIIKLSPKGKALVKELEKLLES